MALNLTCPACAAAFALGDDARYKKAFCPKCGASLIISGAGVAKRNEVPQPALTHPASSPVWKKQWFLIAAPLVLLVVGLSVYLLTRDHADESPPPVAKNGGEQPPPTPPAGQPEPVRPVVPMTPTGGTPQVLGVPDHLPKKDPDPTPPVVPVQNPENALALPAIAGWVMLSDGVTLIIALPLQQQLVYIDTVAEKELKRVKLPFKPNLLAVQGKRLFVSALIEVKNEIHVLDLNSGEDKKTIVVPGAWLTSMGCNPEKGLLYAMSPDREHLFMAIDPDAGTAEPVVFDRLGIGNGPQGTNPYSLVMDPSNADVLYVSTIKFAVKGKVLKAIWSYPVVYNSGGAVQLCVSGDGKRVSALVGDKCPGGDLGVTLFDVKTMTGAARSMAGVTGVADCGYYPRELAMHPVLDLGVVEQIGVTSVNPSGTQVPMTVLHLFNCTSLAETTFKVSDNVNGQLLTFGARGTKLIYFDGAGYVAAAPPGVSTRPMGPGYLRSIPLKLTDKDKEVLAKAYPVK